MLNARWTHGNVVLLGDAAHTAHFSIGSGTKLAMEDALALAACLQEQPDTPAALEAYEAERAPVVASTQRAAQASLEWFEDIGRYVHQEPPQFAFNILTRSRRVTYDNLRVRDARFVERVDEWFQRNEVDRGVARTPRERRPPMFTPFSLRELELKNRVVVSAMDMYSSFDGTPGDFHLVHLGGKALGGAALVMTEMVCIGEAARITPGCAGMYTSEHEPAWRRIVDFVHEHSTAKIGLQLGHAGRKGSTRLMWDGIDEPLEEGNWPLVSPSAIPYRAGVNQVPCALTTAEMDEIRDQFVTSTRMAERSGFDLLELHCAHGYLLSSFLSPITNQRTDSYGGTLENRMRFPLEVFRAMRAVWPEHKPITVRISATDWIEGGNTGADAVAIASAFAEAGVDAVDVSTGQVAPEEEPAFGRSYQTPFADRVRNELDVATIAVGAISSYDDVNSILLAGRADLCALGRPHLYDPQWTLHAAAQQGYRGEAAPWPKQFQAVGASLRPDAPTGRNPGCNSSGTSGDAEAAGSAPYDDDRAAGVVRALVAHGPEQRSHEATMSAVAEHEHLGSGGGFQQHLRGVPVAHLPADLDRRPGLALGLVDGVVQALVGGVLELLGRHRAALPAVEGRELPGDDREDVGEGELRLPQRPDQCVFRGVGPVDPDHDRPFVSPAHGSPPGPAGKGHLQCAHRDHALSRAGFRTFVSITRAGIGAVPQPLSSGARSGVSQVAVPAVAPVLALRPQWTIVWAGRRRAPIRSIE